MRNRETLDTFWEVPNELWERIEPIIGEKDPTKPRDASAPILVRCSTASSSAYVAATNRTNYPKSLGMTAPSIALFNGGWSWGSCAECGKSWSRGAKS